MNDLHTNGTSMESLRNTMPCSSAIFIKLVYCSHTVNTETIFIEFLLLKTILELFSKVVIS